MINHQKCPDGWRSYRIGDCLERVGNPVEIDPDAMYTQIGIRSHGKGLFYKEPVSGAELGNKAVFWIEPDCFILNIVFAWEQAIGKTTAAEVGMIGSHRFPMYRPVKDLVDIDYLIYYFLTKKGTDILKAASPGGAGRNRTLGQDRFLKSKIVLPPIDEQRRIAKILSTQDRVIELYDRKIEQLKRFKKGALSRLFPKPGCNTSEIRFPGFSEPWERRRFKDIFIEYSEKGHANLPVLTIIQGFGTVRRDESDRTLHYDRTYLSNYKMVNADDFIVHLRSFEGGLERATDTGIISPAYHTFHGEGIDSRFYYSYFRSSRFIDVELKPHVFGIRDGRSIDIEGMKSIRIPWTTIQEQQTIGSYIENLDRLITLHQRLRDEEIQKKKALMQLLLTGIVRVKG